MRRALAAAGMVSALTLGLAACGEPTAEQGGSPPAAQTPDVPDCDAEDWKKKEVPDCGFKHRGKFYAWSWARDGHKVAPPDWSASREKASTIRSLTTRPAASSR